VKGSDLPDFKEHARPLGGAIHVLNVVDEEDFLIKCTTVVLLDLGKPPKRHYRITGALKCIHYQPNRTITKRSSTRYTTALAFYERHNAHSANPRMYAIYASCP